MIMKSLLKLCIRFLGQGALVARIQGRMRTRMKPPKPVEGTRQEPAQAAEKPAIGEQTQSKDKSAPEEPTQGQTAQGETSQSTE